MRLLCLFFHRENRFAPDLFLGSGLLSRRPPSLVFLDLGREPVFQFLYLIVLEMAQNTSHLIVVYIIYHSFISLSSPKRTKNDRLYFFADFSS